MKPGAIEATAAAAAPTQPTLVCWKVWGGNAEAHVPLAVPGLQGYLYSRPMSGERGGDLYYFSACGSGALARLCIADVTGHGASVATFSGWLEEVFARHIHRASPAGVLREVNRRAAHRGLEVMSTAVCLSYNSLNGALAYCSAGHPPVRLCRAGEHTWEPLYVQAQQDNRLHNLPLAVETDVQYTLGRLQLVPGDRLLIHTDGLTEVLDGDSRQLGAVLWEEGRVPGSDAPLSAVVEALHGQIARHAADPGALEDDVTLVVLEVQPYQTSNRYTLFIKNNFDRVAQAMLRSRRE